MSVDAVAVANFLVELDQAHHPGRPQLTNMALQKLLYFAEGKSLADGPSLFENTIQAWDYGPVVPDAYHAFKFRGANPIEGPVATMASDGRVWRWLTPSLSELPVDARERVVATQIYERLGNLSAVELMALSHTPDGPWARVYQRGNRHLEIPRSMLRDYFREHSV